MDQFDAVFESYARYFQQHGARPDREARAPGAFAALWDRRGWRPAAERTVLVTGSKGKGTVTRHIAWNLQQAASVGLLVSPEEKSHLDRIRVNNRPIDAATFDRLWRALQAERPRMAEEAGDDRYLSPTGWFLTVALAWFRECGVQWVVVEGGRGVRFDEIGQLDATLGVVTSVHEEHKLALGPTLADIFDDKLSLARRCRRLLVGAQVQARAQELGRPLPAQAIVSPRRLPGAAAGHAAPDWLAVNEGMAADAVRQLLPGLPFHWYGSPSFFQTRLGRTDIVLEPVVHPDSLDPVFLQQLARDGAGVVLGLPDDKAVAGILARLDAAGLHDLAAFALASPIGHVRSSWMAQRSDVCDLGKLDVVFPDVAGLRERLAAHAATRRRLYVIGVQVFTRTMRSLLDIPLGGPSP